MANGDDNRSSFDNSAQEAKGTLDFTKQIIEANKARTESLSGSIEAQRSLIKMLQDAKGLTSEINEGELSKQALLERQAKSQDLLSRLQEEQTALLEQQGDGNLEIVAAIEEQINKAEELISKQQEGIGKLQESSNGVTGMFDKLENNAQGLQKSLKLPSGFSKGISNMAKGARKAAAGGAGFAKSLMGAFKGLAKNPMMLLVTGVIALVKALLAANNKITALAKGLGVSKNEARAINRNINQVARSSDNMLNTTKEIGKAFADINTFLGTSSTIISGELMDGVATLQNRMGLSKEAAMGFMQASLLSGEKINDMKLEALGVSNAVSATYGTRLDDKAVLEEAAKTTGVIRAQSGGNLDILVKSVATAKSFGISLKEVANAGRQLLNFEQSISAELEAELLTGKQLNLERARLAALTGDYETVTKEIMKNVGGINDFMNLNVLQQEALAKSVGMEANQLSDVLLKKQNIEELAEEARKGGNEDLARQYEQLSTQQKFNAAIEKLKDFVVY